MGAKRRRWRAGAATGIERSPPQKRMQYVVTVGCLNGDQVGLQPRVINGWSIRSYIGYFHSRSGTVLRRLMFGKKRAKPYEIDQRGFWSMAVYVVTHNGLYRVFSSVQIRNMRIRRRGEEGGYSGTSYGLPWWLGRLPEPCGSVIGVSTFLYGSL